MLSVGIFHVLLSLRFVVCLVGIAGLGGCGSALVDSRGSNPVSRNTDIQNPSDFEGFDNRGVSRLPASSVVTLPDREEDANYHTVVKGETLRGIAGKYKQTLSRLIEANGLESNAVLQPGQLLYIPK